jgi:hypothetical protein
MKAWFPGLLRSPQYGGLTLLGAARRSRGRPRRRRRQMKTRRRVTWRSLFAAPLPQLIALVMVLGGFYALATSRVFAITQVQVVGDAGLPAGLFRRDCDCLGASIFLTQPAAIRGRLRRIPWVDVRWVSARLPDRLVIAATYRRPALLWRTTVATYTVDAFGTVLYDVQAPPVPRSTVPTTATLPLVYSPHDTTFVSGHHVPPVAVQMVRATRAQLAPDIARSVSVYRWSPYSGLTVHSRRGWWFLLGSNLKGALRLRLQALAVADTKQDLAGCNYVDLRPLPNIYCTNDPAWSSPLGPGSVTPSPGPRITASVTPSPGPRITGRVGHTGDGHDASVPHHIYGGGT